MKYPKHPGFRCSDFAYWQPEYQKILVDFVESLRSTLHPFIAKNMVRFEICGSQVFGNAKLRSDVDINIAMPNWDMQVEARRIFRGNIGKYRDSTGKLLLDFAKQWGLEFSLGCVDCDTQKYNINVSLDDMVLHHRYSPYPEELYADESGIIWAHEDKPVDLKTFNPLTDEEPPVANIHLRFNPDMWRWQRVDLDVENPPSYMSNKQGRWSEDPWINLIPGFQQLYGSRFQTYHQVGSELIQD